MPVFIIDETSGTLRTNQTYGEFADGYFVVVIKATNAPLQKDFTKVKVRICNWFLSIAYGSSINDVTTNGEGSRILLNSAKPIVLTVWGGVQKLFKITWRHLWTCLLWLNLCNSYLWPKCSKKLKCGMLAKALRSDRLVLV